MILPPSDTNNPDLNKIAQDFQTDVFRLHRRLDHWQYSILASIVLSRSLDDRSVFKRYPPHFLVQSMEAALVHSHPAYIKSHVTEAELNNAINLFHDNSGVFPSALLDSRMEITEFLAGTAWEQFYVQEQSGKEDLGRAISIYEHDDALPRSSAWFKDQTGMTIREWFVMYFSVFSLIIARLKEEKPPVFNKKNILDSPIRSLPKAHFDKFLELSSKPLSWFKERYKEKRSDCISPSHYWHIRSSFLEAPIIDFGQRGFLVPHADFLVRFASQGLHRFMAGCPDDRFPNEISKSFERYVEKLLRLARDAISIRGERAVRKLVSGKAADFVLEFDDCILVIECKATDYSSTLRTGRAIEKSNSSGKIAKGFSQIVDTVEFLIQSGFVGKRDCIGAVVLLGDLDFPNSEWHRQRVLVRSKHGEDRPNGLALPIQILPIKVLEDLIGAILHLGVSPLSLFKEKEAVPYAICGDWASFLRDRVGDDGKVLMNQLTFLMEITDRFFDEMLEGVPS